MNSLPARFFIVLHLCSSRLLTLVLIIATIDLMAASASGEPTNETAVNVSRSISPNVLTKEEWKAVEVSVDNGLKFLSSQHRADGSFQSVVEYDPGITGLCLMAFLSRGHVPGQGPFGEKLLKSVDFVMKCQQSDGLISRQRESFAPSYNHAISALVLSEVFGMARPLHQARMREVIEKAIEFTSHRYSQPKLHPEDEGSWRYLKRHGEEYGDGDLSITSWNVMFLRSAKNSGFEIDARLIEEALAYMKRVYDPEQKTFRYEIHTLDIETKDPLRKNCSRAMAGAGLLSLAMAGEHNSELAQNAARHILKHPFQQYFRPVQGEIYACYAAFYCSHATFQMGGEYWSQFYPQLVKSVLKEQREDGSWLMGIGYESHYGASYATALTLLALTPSYQQLPIFQR